MSGHAHRHKCLNFITNLETKMVFLLIGYLCLANLIGFGSPTILFSLSLSLSLSLSHGHTDWTCTHRHKCLNFSMNLETEMVFVLIGYLCLGNLIGFGSPNRVTILLLLIEQGVDFHHLCINHHVLLTCTSQPTIVNIFFRVC
ncbi:hypothetical protein TorRG33x02_183750 [Trema orientale]|uniref:Uncharacterized protein n=1 Tax=Trema orientale TaxID=63057 RepID=A0A2P5EJP0_TREOI|nr:hypothetical protein TorRG33x02_183750 [Trema orientale]